MLGLQNEREWAAFCKIVLLNVSLTNDPRFDSNAHRNDHREVLKVIITDVFKKLTAQEVDDRLDKARIANGRMNDMADLWAHPQLKSRQRWRTIGSPAGDIPALLPPGRNKDFEYRMGPVPRLGQHTESILLEIGHTNATIEALRALSAI